MSYWAPMELTLLEENRDKIDALDKDNPTEVVAFVENLIGENLQGLLDMDIYKWRFGFYGRLIPQSLKVVIGSDYSSGDDRFVHFKINTSFNFKGGAIVVFNSHEEGVSTMVVSDYMNYQKDPIKFKDFLIAGLPKLFNNPFWKRVNIDGCFEREMGDFLRENDKFEMEF